MAALARTLARDDRGVIRFLIVEDHPLFCDALESAVCLAHPQADILRATSIDEALGLLSSTHEIDLILLDLSMPGTSGLSGVIRIRTSFPKSPIIIVSGYEDSHIINGVLALGVSGYIPKSTSKNEIADAISEVLRGSISLPKNFRDTVKSRQSNADVRDLLQRIRSLTPQQLRVLEMLRAGLQNKQIAYRLTICETTVKVHVSEILRKLKVLNRSHAIIEVSKIDFANLAGERPAKIDRSDLAPV